MLSLSENTKSEVIEAFNPTSRYVDDLFNIDKTFDSTINHISPSKFQLNKVNVLDTET